MCEKDRFYSNKNEGQIVNLGEILGICLKNEHRAQLNSKTIY